MNEAKKIIIKVINEELKLCEDLSLLDMIYMILYKDRANK